MRHAILDFAQRYWPVVDLLLVHCEAGTSRSPAVAAALSRIYLGHDGEFLLPHLYQPNRLVLDTLLEVARQRGLLAGEESSHGSFRARVRIPKGPARQELIQLKMCEAPPLTPPEYRGDDGFGSM